MCKGWCWETGRELQDAQKNKKIMLYEVQLVLTEEIENCRCFKHGMYMNVHTYQYNVLTYIQSIAH